MQETYLLKDYSKKDENRKPELSLLTEDELFALLQNRSDNKETHEIAVYKIGKCVLNITGAF